MSSALMPSTKPAGPGPDTAPAAGGWPGARNHPDRHGNEIAVACRGAAHPLTAVTYEHSFKAMDRSLVEAGGRA
jgi:hypothetical protein